jgi:hypothetical protein
MIILCSTYVSWKRVTESTFLHQQYCVKEQGTEKWKVFNYDRFNAGIKYCAVLVDSPPGTWTFWEPGLHVHHANQFSFLPLYLYRALDNISCTWIFIPLSDLDLNTSATNSVWVCWAKFCFGIDLVTSRES